MHVWQHGWIMRWAQRKVNRQKRATSCGSRISEFTRKKRANMCKRRTEATQERVPTSLHTRAYVYVPRVQTHLKCQDTRRLCVGLLFKKAVALCFLFFLFFFSWSGSQGCHFILKGCLFLHEILLKFSWKTLMCFYSRLWLTCLLFVMFNTNRKD